MMREDEPLAGGPGERVQGRLTASCTTASPLYALPNLVIIGAMKCGTSALHRYLDQHPQIAMSEPKELNFFFAPTASRGNSASSENRDDRALDDWPGRHGSWHRGAAWYARHFPAGAPVRGESSPGYTSPSYPGVAERMAALIPPPSSSTSSGTQWSGLSPSIATTVPRGPKLDPWRRRCSIRAASMWRADATTTGSHRSSGTSSRSRSLSSPVRNCSPTAERRCNRSSGSSASKDSGPATCNAVGTPPGGPHLSSPGGFGTGWRMHYATTQTRLRELTGREFPRWSV